MKREKQPAKVSYFFGPGWKNLGEFTKIFWNLNRDDVRKRQKKFESGMGVMSIRGVANLISCFMLILFGTAFFVNHQWRGICDSWNRLYYRLYTVFHCVAY